MEKDGKQRHVGSNIGVLAEEPGRRVDELVE